MKRVAFFSLLMLVFVRWTFAQSQISITPIVPDELDLNSSLSNTLKHRLLQMATVNGFGSSSGEFVLTVNIIPLEKEVLPTVPVTVKVNLEVSVYAVGVAEQIIIDELSFEVGAMAKNEAMAMGSAFRKINPRKPEIKAFMASVREKIENYYIDRTPVLIAKAQQLADKGEFDQALAVLSTIPESVSEYMTVSEMMRTVHQQMIDKYALMSIQEAKNNMILKKYPEALDCLLYVDPMSNHAKEAKAMVNQIQQTIEANDRAAYEARIKAQEQKMEMAQRAQDNEVMLRKMQLEASYTAAEKVNKENSESLSDKVSSWLFGKLK